MSSVVINNSPYEMRLEEIPELEPKSVKVLRDSGIENPGKIMEFSLDELEKLGLSKVIIKKIRNKIMSLYPTYYRNTEDVINLEDIDGIGPSTAKVLRDKGINVKLLIATPIKELENRYGLSANSVTKFQNSILEKKGCFVNALTLLNKQKDEEVFTFGCESLDDLFMIPGIKNGGINLGDTYEFFGAFRTGKSQLCHQLSVSVQLPKKYGGVNKKAIYIDTEGTFAPSRIIQIATRFKDEYDWEKNIQDILSDILYARAKTSDMQQQIVIKLLDLLTNHPNEYGVLIIDSVTAHFRAEYMGRGALAERQQVLNHHLSILSRIANTFGLAVIITNQVQVNPGLFFGDPTIAVGGNIIGHWAKYRCYLRKAKGDSRIFKIFDSSTIPEVETIFKIAETGIVSSN